MNKSKQQLEMEINRLNIDLDNATQASLMERKRLEDEVARLRSRLDSTQNILTSCRQENLNLVECKASLEREQNLIREHAGIHGLPPIIYRVSS